ncbi:thiopurine S-methyltransferase [Stutzerimonas kirkiae]|uniref:Thiopurine S-methyltransferase n=1 Tax=Stutzerimonas kirkiae TaxID=2211392 RepID=A0A4Q9RDX5_9GAMM|nr:thiopurine S-methyltransferase [Stutzerimonas kirkiae]TBU98803.1 thiopurine S-methyltransferase [Stutzerimonas kirkiae]TBV03897.1 thiopurine S-methyltransferase [Stutzerimonas kirkiae]
MTDRDNQLWLRLWRERRTDFHQRGVNRLLSRFWPAFAPATGSRVFVPLCGKSLDMLWLAERGHDVIGVELSPLAVAAFFRENHLQPSKHRQGRFTLWRHGRIAILCGDYFALAAADLGPVDSVYDRAALTALPPTVRARYVAQLRRIVPDSAGVFLLTLEDAEEGASLQQAQGVDGELAALYRADFEIALTHVHSLFETDPQSGAPCRVEYKLYQLSGKAPAD